MEYRLRKRIRPIEGRAIGLVKQSAAGPRRER